MTYLLWLPQEIITRDKSQRGKLLSEQDTPEYFTVWLERNDEEHIPYDLLLLADSSRKTIDAYLKTFKNFRCYTKPKFHRRICFVSFVRYLG